MPYLEMSKVFLLALAFGGQADVHALIWGSRFTSYSLKASGVSLFSTSHEKGLVDALSSASFDPASLLDASASADLGPFVENDVDPSVTFNKLQGRLLKSVRQLSLDYKMLEDGDHIMVCVSGGKDSATLLYLLRILQQKLPINFDITAVHVDQKQPGYNGTSLVEWLRDDMKVDYEIVEEDTYSIVVEKTAPNKSYCTVCSRLRRGILYSKAIDLKCNKIALGHHADDCLETAMLNMIHAGQLKGMPARYTSHAREVPLAVIRPLMMSMESDIAEFARLADFPILPCNLCSNQANLQRPQVKLLLSTLQSLNPQAKQNMLRSLQTVKPSHLLDQSLREACGMDPVTGALEENENDSEFNF